MDARTSHLDQSSKSSPLTCRLRFPIAELRHSDDLPAQIQRIVNLNAIPTMLTMIPAVLRGLNTGDLATIKAIARQAYPAVTQLDLKTLATWMETRESLLLIDVRSPEEFTVSHLRGAVNLRSFDDILNAVDKRRPNAAVLYCSVGFRSSRLAYKLTNRQVAGISNLEGSIFQWANEGRPLYRGETLVQQVHPYRKRWAGLLEKGLASMG